eukprot:CAMPEP_0172623380 /NCGR_PEP_ID=MMETSP1068-20121228/128143_1 /TAXON_ID=35684 /ORGANISM="Pseudopedinella elastica, Strain CCMP716" /LENGTH=102 /DNA_ID=CAMNT_0013431933 /DNA_START=704 /DNA_END=1013 /DNA_ORIENTATION=+
MGSSAASSEAAVASAFFSMPDPQGSLSIRLGLKTTNAPSSVVDPQARAALWGAIHVALAASFAAVAEALAAPLSSGGASLAAAATSLTAASTQRTDETQGKL